VTDTLYHDEQERLWDELREIDRLEKQRREEQERKDKEAARQSAVTRGSPAVRRSSLRSWPSFLAIHHRPSHVLEEFIKIDSINQPELRARQRRVEERLMKLYGSQDLPKPTGRPQFSESDRLRRRARHLVTQARRWRSPAASTSS